jgi:hypothetical protein
LCLRWSGGDLEVVLRWSWGDLEIPWESWGYLGCSWGGLGESWGSLGRPWGGQGIILDPFLSDVGAIFESFWGPKSTHFRDTFLDDMFHGLGVDLGSIWELKWTHVGAWKRSESGGVDFQKLRFYLSKAWFWKTDFLGPEGVFLIYIIFGPVLAPKMIYIKKTPSGPRKSVFQNHALLK